MIGLGIDTSCYMTSVALCTLEEQLLADIRIPVSVPQGGRGVRQQEAIFQHINHLPEAVERVSREANQPIGFICVSDKPRPVEGSYMPVFLAGLCVARSMASMLGVPLYHTTHQESHLAAGKWSCGKAWQDKQYIGLHVSGGTTEILMVTERADGKASVKRLGGTRDLHAGQFLDRVGVRMGFPFPAGRHLDAMVQSSEIVEVPEIPSSVKGLECSFSGAEAAAFRALERGMSKEAVAKGVLTCVTRTVEKLIRNASMETELHTALMTGGVAASHVMRKALQQRIGPSGIVLHFADPAWSGDNAVGTALNGAAMYRHDQGDM